MKENQSPGQRILARIMRRRRAHAMVSLAALGIALLETLPPKFAGRIVDQMRFSGKIHVGLIAALIAAWALVLGIVYFLQRRQIRIGSRAAEETLAELREEVFAHLQRLPMAYFDRTDSGKILARATEDVESMRNLVNLGPMTIVSNGAILILASVMLYLTNARLFFSVVWLAPLLAYLSYRCGRDVTAAWKRVRGDSLNVQSNQIENIIGVRVVAAFNRQPKNLDRYNQLQHINTKSNVSAARVSASFGPIIQGVKLVGQLILLVFGAREVSSGRLGIGSFIACTLYWEWFMQPASNFGAFFNDALIAMASADKVFSILDEEADETKEAGDVTVDRVEGMVEFENVGFSYAHNTRPALKNVNFQVRPGSLVAVVGSTGSGKSTILSLLSRFYRPQEGRILIDGFDLWSLESKSFSRQFAMVLQMNYLFGGSILDNIRYAKPDATEDEIIAAAKMLGCDEAFRRLKNGYHSEVGESGSRLSLGERQMVCITRAMLSDPRILLLDEATSSLDLLTESRMQYALQMLMRNRTTFVVAHRLSTVVNADKIVVVERGEIVEQGTHQELLRVKGRYFELQHKNAVTPQGV